MLLNKLVLVDTVVIDSLSEPSFLHTVGRLGYHGPPPKVSELGVFHSPSPTPAESSFRYLVSTLSRSAPAWNRTLFHSFVWQK